jgi:hypothetical protein
MLSAASVACAPCRRLAWGDPAMTRLESNARSPPKRHAQGEPPVDPTSPDAMFKSEASSLKKSASAWWSHMRYILVAALAVSFALHHVAAAAEAKCSRGLDVDLLDARGASEVTRKWHRCFVPNFDDTEFRPFDDWGSWNVYFIRHTRLWSSWSTDNAFFAMTLAWFVSNAHSRVANDKNTKKSSRGFFFSRGAAYFAAFFVFFLVPAVDYQVTGHKHLGSWIVSFTCFVFGVFLFVTDKRLRHTETLTSLWFYVVYGLGGLSYLFAVSFLNAAGGARYGVSLKLLIRFVIDPLIWETMKTAQRHVALLSPSPGPGLDVVGFMGPIINQSVYSRLLLFMMTNDGAVDLLTVQIVISLNELMLNLTIKHRDAVFTRSTLGTATADAILATKKADSMHVSSILATSFCELAAVATLTGFMATFNLPSSPDVYDDATGLVNPTRPPRTTDPSKLTGQAFRLIAIELAFSFLSAFAQYRFHDIDLRRPFDGDGERGDEDKNLSRDEKKQKTKETNAKRSRLEDEKKPFFFGVKNVFSLSLDKNRIRAYFVMAVFFAMCVVGTLLGTLWTYAVCPRVRRSDGHLFFSFCEPTESKHFPGGPPAESEGILAWQFDWPPRMNGNKAAIE